MSAFDKLALPCKMLREAWIGTELARGGCHPKKPILLVADDDPAILRCFHGFSRLRADGW